MTALVLSISDQKIARKLTRLLLVDPLAAEGAWEQQLEDTRLDDGRGILLRFYHHPHNC